MNAIGLYRSFIRTCRLVPCTKESSEAFVRIHTGFRENRSEKDEEKIAELLKDGESRLRFLKTKARKSSYYRTHKANVHVMIDGEKVIETRGAQGLGKEFAYHKDDRIDVDAVKRHHKLIRRQHFIDRPPIK